MLFINSGYTYRVPTYTDLYYEDPVNSGNPALQPEYALANEIGLKSKRLRGISFGISLFNRTGSNMIDRVKENVDDRWMPVNINKVIYNGADISFEINPRLLMKKDYGINLLSVSYTYINAYTLGEIPQFSRWEFENLRDQLAASIAFRYSDKLSQTINFRYYNRVSMDTYSLLDTRISWTEENLSVNVDISNITNIEYRETNLVTMPGRWISAGVSYNFKLQSL